MSHGQGSRARLQAVGQPRPRVEPSATIHPLVDRLDSKGPRLMAKFPSGSRRADGSVDETARVTGEPRYLAETENGARSTEAREQRC